MQGLAMVVAIDLHIPAQLGFLDAHNVKMLILFHGDPVLELLELLIRLNTPNIKASNL